MRVDTSNLIGFRVAGSVADAHARISTEIPPDPRVSATGAVDLASALARVGIEVGNGG